MRIYRSVYERIKSTLGRKFPEEGGILLTNDGGYTVTDFVYDDRGSRSGGTYSPNTAFINEQIRLHNKSGAYFLGFIHSHPRGYTGLSMGVSGHTGGYTASDEEAIYKLFRGMKGTRRLYFPVVQSAAGGGEFSVRAFKAERQRDGSVRISEDCVDVVDDGGAYEREIISSILDTKRYAANAVVLIDMRHTADAAVLLARKGVSNFVLLDAEKIKDSDLGAFADYGELGGYIADYAARRIKRINPAANVRIIRYTVDDETDAEDFEKWLAGVNRAKSLAWFYGNRPERLEYIKRLCRESKLPLISMCVNAERNILHVERRDYYAARTPVVKREYAYVRNGRNLDSAIAQETRDRIIDFFGMPTTAKKLRRAAATSAEQPPAYKFASLYPRSVIADKKVILVGCGGSRSYAENLARSGIRNFVLIDGDAYSPTNLQTQMAYADELGVNKAQAIAECILRICPDARVTVVPKMLDGKVSDGEFEYMAGDELKTRPHDVLIAACTDNFKANARCSRLALKYGTPFLQAGINQGGYILEIEFFHPAVSHVCPRCMFEKRYKVNLSDNPPPPAVSDGTSVYVTEELNAKKGFISLGLLLYGCEDADRRYSEFLRDNMLVSRGGKRETDRNMLLYTLCTDLAQATGKSALARLDKLGRRMGRSYQSGVCLYREQKPKKGCPDCGGTGDLAAVKGAIADTREGIYAKEEY